MRQYRFDIQQNTEEWEQIKFGMFSASSAADLLMAKKSAGYTKLIDKIVEERITKEKTESKTFTGNSFTERGHEFEPLAREDYELRSFNDVKSVGVVQLDEWVLCSPDGLIDDNGLYQAKCPIFNTQRHYLKIIHNNADLTNADLFKKINSSYYKQLQFELHCTGREYNVFNSYHPKLKAIDIIVERDEVLIAEIEQRLNEAQQEVQSEINFINSLTNN